jgi:hypothetical protein
MVDRVLKLTSVIRKLILKLLAKSVSQKNGTILESFVFNIISTLDSVNFCKFYFH